MSGPAGAPVAMNDEQLDILARIESLTGNNRCLFGLIIKLVGSDIRYATKFYVFRKFSNYGKQKTILIQTNRPGGRERSITIDYDCRLFVIATDFGRFVRMNNFYPDVRAGHKPGAANINSIARQITHFVCNNSRSIG